MACVVLKRLKHNLLEVLLEEVIRIIKRSLSKMTFQGSAKLGIPVLHGHEVMLDHYPPNSNVICFLFFFLHSFVRLLIWIEIAVNLTAKVFCTHQDGKLNIHSNCLIFWDLYHYSKFLKTFKMPGLLFSIFYMFIHISATHPVSVHYIII